MRRIINSTYVSLDGLTEQLQDWHFQYHDDEATAVAIAELTASDAVILGRKTYESFASVWPTLTDAYSDRMNAVSKHVASTTLVAPEWNNTSVIEGDLATSVAVLKQQPGQDIMSYGFGPVARTLLHNGLLDEIHLWIHPIIVGKAGPEDLLFQDSDTATFELVDTRSLTSGIVILSYRPTR